MKSKRIIQRNGTERWYSVDNGIPHREDGPAVIYPNKYEARYLNGKYHREDGPARIWYDEREEWWLDGKRIRSDNSDEFKAYWKELVSLYHIKKIVES